MEVINPLAWTQAKRTASGTREEPIYQLAILLADQTEILMARSPGTKDEEAFWKLFKAARRKVGMILDELIVPQAFIAALSILKIHWKHQSQLMIMYNVNYINRRGTLLTRSEDEHLSADLIDDLIYQVNESIWAEAVEGTRSREAVQFAQVWSQILHAEIRKHNSNGSVPSATKYLVETRFAAAQQTRLILTPTLIAQSALELYSTSPFRLELTKLHNMLYAMNKGMIHDPVPVWPGQELYSLFG